MLFFNVHTHNKSSSDKEFAILNKYPTSVNFNVPFSIGIHPWYLTKESLKTHLQLVKNNVQKDNCFALGECGLDKKCNTDFTLQIEAFKEQILLSENYNKPLIIHCVKAYQELLALYKKHKPKQTWVVHGFNKSAQLANSLLQNNISLSFGSAILNNFKLQQVFLKMPLNKILLETDASNTQIINIYKKAAEIKQLEIKVLKEQIEHNFKNIFIQ